MDEDKSTGSKLGDDIFKDVRRIQEEMDLLFAHFYKLKHSPVLTSRRIWRPPTDVFETEDKIIIIMEIAGMKPEDFSLTLANNVLNIRGERKVKTTTGRTMYQNMEINQGPFERNIRLQEPVDSDNIQATYRAGFLEIKIPKCKERTTQAEEIKIELE